MMNKLRGYKFKYIYIYIYIYDTFARQRVSGWGCHRLVGIGASRIRFGPANRVGSKKGCHMHALIDLGSTHSYVCIEHVFDKIPAVERLAYDMHVTSPLGHSVSVNRLYRNCPIIIQAREFLADLITLPFREFDLILGMDWLSKHRAIVDCGQKTVVLRCSGQSKVIAQGVRSGIMSNVISAMQARRLMRKGCETFLALILDSKRDQVDLEKVAAVREFPDVFPEELLGIPLEREVDLSI